MGRSKPPTRSSAPPRVKVTKHFTENSSPQMNTFIKNARQDKSDAAKMNTVQMDPPGGRRRMGRAAKVQTPESESSLSPVDADSSNDGGNAGGGSGTVNATGSECRRSSRKKTIKFDVRDLLNKNRKSHKIQIEARIDSNAPKTGAGPASKEELDNKQKTFIEKSAIFRRYSFSENKQPPRPPPPPVALIKTIQQCVGELEQLPLDRDIDLAAISPIARRLSKTQEILTASMMKPKQVNSLIVTKLENATTTTPATTRRGARQKQSAVQSPSPPIETKRRGRPRKGKTITGVTDSTTESSNDSSDVSGSVITTISTTDHECLEGETKSDEDFMTTIRDISVSPSSSTKAIDLKEKTDASAVTLSPSELMEPNMFVGAEEEVFTQGLSSDESTIFLRSSPKEKSNDEISLFGRSDSTETNSSDDSERRRKKIRVSVKRVTLPSALREHVDFMLKSNSSTPDVIEVLSSNDDESFRDPKEDEKGINKSAGETSSSLRIEESSQDSSKSMQTRGCIKREIERSLGQLGLVVDADSNSMTIGSVVEISSDSAATPVDEILTKRETTSPQLRVTPTRRLRNCRRIANESVLEEQSARDSLIEGSECASNDVQENVCLQFDVTTDVEKNASIIQTRGSPLQTKKSVQTQSQDVPSLQVQSVDIPPILREKPVEAATMDVREEPNEKNVPTNNAVNSPAPRTRSQKDLHTETIEIIGSGVKQNVGSRRTPSTRSISLRKRKEAVEKESDSSSPTILTESAERMPIVSAEEPEASCSTVSATEGLSFSEQEIETPRIVEKLDTQEVESNEKIVEFSSTTSEAMVMNPVVQRTEGEGQKLRVTRTTKTSEVNALSLPEVEIKDKETGGKESSPKRQSISRRKTPSETPQQEHTEEIPEKGLSPVTKKTMKATKHFTRVISIDQSSSSSERSESPKNRNKKNAINTDKSKEDTSSICSESSSIESSSSSRSSFSSTTASSKSSSTSSATSTSSKSSTSSTSTSSSSTSSSSLSDGHGRTTRSRKSQQIVLDPAEDSNKHPQSLAASKASEAPRFTEPDSENSERSLRRGKVKTAFDISPKERAKLVHRRRSVRANRFLLDEESTETSSESSETSSSKRMTRTSRSKVRSEVPSALKKTSQSVESRRSPKLATTESEVSPTSLQTEKTPEELLKDGAKLSGDQLLLESRSRKKPGRFVPLKGGSAEKELYDDPSVSGSTMRETRARRKTISSASELEELVDHRIGKGAEQKKQVIGNETLPLDEVDVPSQDGQKMKVAEKKEAIGLKTEADDGSMREDSASVGNEKLVELAKGKDDDKVITTSEDQCLVETNEVVQKRTERTETEGSDKSDLGSDNSKAETKNINIDTQSNTVNALKGVVNDPDPRANTENEAKDESVTLHSDRKLEEIKTACIIDTLNSKEDDSKNNTERPRIPTLSSTGELSSDINEAQPMEGSALVIEEEQRTQCAEINLESDASPAEPAKLDESVKVAERFVEDLGMPVSLSEIEEQTNKRNEQIVEEVVPVPKAESISAESMPTIESKEICGSDPVRTTGTESDPTLVSTLEVDDAAVVNTKLELSSTGLQDKLEDSTTSIDPELIHDTVSENENSIDLQTAQIADKKDLSPFNEKKTQQEPHKVTHNEQNTTKKTDLDEATNELATPESSNSDDSLKSDATKPTPSRQLDSSFIDSLEKSLMKPTSGKKFQKKKEKPQPTSATPKEKEDGTKATKKNQEVDLKKVDSIASPKLKKNKRKSVAKKPLEGPKPLDTGDPKIEVPESKVSDVPPQPVLEDTSVPFPEVEIQQPTEVTINPPKPMKSKGETKFYPDEHPLEEKVNATTEACPSSDVLKDDSPDSVPDPLKDIEKFIEDGVNLLKRGYKLDENEQCEGATPNDVAKLEETTTPKKCKLDENPDDKKQAHPAEDDNSNSNSEHSLVTSTPSSDVETPNGIRRSHRIKNNSKSAKCLVGRGLVRDRERFSMKDDEKTVYSIDDQKMDLAEVEAKNSKFLKDMEERLSNFRVIRENEYKCERVISKEAKRMLCDCFLTAEEEERGELGCGEDCLNRLLMIECGSDCTVKERCTNRRFTKFLYSPCRVFRTEKKGFGIMADIEILPGEFIMEYVGEVIDGDEFERRRNAYSQDKNKHYYFMALRSDAIIDATAKGNVSRFINHSCDPNAETQKWTVNGELRIGFFSRKSIMPGEEITFDYQYQRYGKEAQKCYCESSNCRGWIGEEPSSEEEEEEEEIDEEEGETESEEEEDQETVALPAIPVTSPPITIEGEQLVAEVPAVVGQDVETAELLPVFAQVTVEADKPSTEIQPKKKKEKRRQLERKDEKIKRRETKQFLEDPDIEDEVRFLVKCGLRNQADTLRLSRLIVRAKLLGTRLNLLQILRAGELPCRRLFLDYHGLRLLHGWMSEVIDTRDCEKSMEIRMALLSVLECLPISNKTMLTDSKVYQTVRDWSHNKESHSPSDESPKETTTAAVTSVTSPVRSEDHSTELQKLAAKLVSTWDNLPEVFRIPKRERIEQMKEHEREADRQYKGLAENMSGSEDRRNRDRFIRNGPYNSRFKWSRSDKDKERERIGDRRRYLVNGGSAKDGVDKTQGVGDSHLSKEQRRELFAAKVARDEAEKRLAEERREFDIKCRFFGLDPKRLRPENMPFCVNPSTGQWYSTDKKPISTPPSYAHVQVPVKPKSTNPTDYQLPLMDLPPLWKFAISPKGKIYYYHVKIRIPQWEPPIKILPLAGKKDTHVKTSESDSSNAECADSSDDDIDIIKGLDPVKLQTYIEKKIEDRRLQRYNRLVDEKPISPRKEEDRIYNQMEVRKYKENKEKIRKRKEEIRRRRDTIAKVTTSIEPNQPEATAAENDEVAVDAIPIQDYLLSSDEEDKIKEECNNSPLIDKIVQGDKIVDELDALQCKRPLKRALPIREKYEHKKRKVDKNKESTKSTKRSKDGEGSSSSSSSKYRKIREKFRCEIAGIIVQHLRPYRKDTCFSGRILTDNDFNHLARKLTHFVMVKELKYCESIGQTLVVTESVKNKSREFIKKYMAKYGGVYVRPKNDPEFKEIPFL